MLAEGTRMTFGWKDLGASDCVQLDCIISHSITELAKISGIVSKLFTKAIHLVY